MSTEVPREPIIIATVGKLNRYLSDSVVGLKILLLSVFVLQKPEVIFGELLELPLL